MATLASIGATLALLAAPVQAGVLINDSFLLDISVLVPCANEGTGEVVDLEWPVARIDQPYHEWQ